MKIGFYVPFIDEKPTGVGVYIYEMLSRLVSQVDCVIYTSRPYKLPAWLYGIEARSCLLGKLPNKSGALARLSRLAWLNFRAAEDLKRHKVDLLFSFVQEGAVIGNLKQVMVMHDLTMLRFPFAYSGMHVLFSKYYLPFALKKSAHTICVSKSTLNDIVRFFKLKNSPLKVIYEGFDQSVFYPPSRAEITRCMEKYALPKKYFFYSGTFSKHKNLSFALRAFSRVIEKQPDAYFVLCGRKDSGDFQSLIFIAKSLGIESRIKMLGYVPREDLRVLMGLSSAYLFPSLFEGFGLAPLEALATGARVISSNAGSLPEVIGEGGVLIDPLDEDGWLDAMHDAISTPWEATVWSQRAQRQAAKFSWDLAVYETIELMRSIAVNSGEN